MAGLLRLVADNSAVMPPRDRPARNALLIRTKSGTLRAVHVGALDGCHDLYSVECPGQPTLKLAVLHVFGLDHVRFRIARAFGLELI